MYRMIQEDFERTSCLVFLVFYHLFHLQHSRSLTRTIIIIIIIIISSTGEIKVIDFLEKTHYVSDLGDDVRFLVWDTAGQEEFDTITRTYVPPPARNTHAHTHAQGKERK